MESQEWDQTGTLLPLSLAVPDNAYATACSLSLELQKLVGNQKTKYLTSLNSKKSMGKYIKLDFGVRSLIGNKFVACCFACNSF